MDFSPYQDFVNMDTNVTMSFQGDSSDSVDTFFNPHPVAIHNTAYLHPYWLDPALHQPQHQYPSPTDHPAPESSGLVTFPFYNRVPSPFSEHSATADAESMSEFELNPTPSPSLPSSSPMLEGKPRSVKQFRRHLRELTFADENRQKASEMIIKCMLAHPISASHNPRAQQFVDLVELEHRIACLDHSTRAWVEEGRQRSIGTDSNRAASDARKEKPTPTLYLCRWCWATFTVKHNLARRTWTCMSHFATGATTRRPAQPYQPDTEKPPLASLSHIAMDELAKEFQERLMFPRAPPSQFRGAEQNINIQNPFVDTSIHSPVMDTGRYSFRSPIHVDCVTNWSPVPVQGSEIPFSILEGSVAGGSSIFNGGYYCQSPQSPLCGSPSIPDVNSTFWGLGSPQDFGFSPITPSDEFTTFGNLNFGSPGDGASMDSDTWSYYDHVQSPQTSLIGSPNYSDVNFGAPQRGTFFNRSSQFSSPENVYSGASPNPPLAAEPILSPFLVPAHSGFPAVLPPDDLLGPSLQRAGGSGSQREQSGNFEGGQQKRKNCAYRAVTDKIVKIMAAVVVPENKEEQPINVEQQKAKLQEYLSYIESLHPDMYKWVSNRRPIVGKKEGKKFALERRTIGGQRKLKYCLWCYDTLVSKVNLLRKP
ncbi:hypothetical protein CVT24_003171 [Panaeolus cyanescens]|uniref:Uncharacterized protein n=1 Tax=Panaeolus cyanescens TaxID=181874 RepID=A0A409VNV2_9AGAR|nr:hypothetical protein CVT24_003171 [Panaeolus cyanescens]